VATAILMPIIFLLRAPKRGAHANSPIVVE